CLTGHFDGDRFSTVNCRKAPRSVSALEGRTGRLPRPAPEHHSFFNPDGMIDIPSRPSGPAWYADLCPPSEIIMANQVQQAQAAGSDYFNLHVSGIGYLNRVRWVEVGKSRNGRRSEPFLCCGVNALHGATNDPARTHFDLKVSGKDAIELIDSLAKAVEARQKVLVSFKAGDI